MGVVYTFLLPVILFMIGVGAFSPIVGLLCVVGAVFSATILIVPARRMVRAERNRLRIIGAVLIPLMAVTTFVLLVLAAIAFVVAVYFYGSMGSAV